MKHRKSFLGVGWKFPPSFDKDHGSIILVSEEEDIKESLFLLLSTKPGERIMQPEYGCDLNKLLFESINSSLITQIKSMIKNAILYFEPRIDLENIEISQDPNNDGILLINVHYVIRKTNNRSNMVYPYYIIEGNEARYTPISNR